MEACKRAKSHFYSSSMAPSEMVVDVETDDDEVEIVAFVSAAAQNTSMITRSRKRQLDLQANIDPTGRWIYGTSTQDSGVVTHKRATIIITNFSISGKCLMSLLTF
jgi:S-adenosylmethionine synthetase